MVWVGSHGKIEHGTASLCHICTHKEVVPASRLMQVTDRLKPFPTAAGIIKCIILIPVLNVLLIKDSLSLHKICILKKTSSKGA